MPILTLSTIFFVQGFSCAQVYVGVKGGYNFSQMLPDPNIDQGLRQGIAGGIVFKEITKPNVGLQAEIMFTQKGWTEEFRLPIGGIAEIRTAAFRYNYIEVPIMTNIRLGKRRFQYFLNIGPHFSYLLGTDSTINKLPEDEVSFRYNEATVVRFEYGASVGVGIAAKIGNGLLQIDGRASYGLNNIIDRDAIGAPLSSQNIVGQVAISYLVNLADLWKKKPKNQDETPKEIPKTLQPPNPKGP